MGRPLRAKYSNGVAIGVQEMSDAEIADIILPKLVNYAIANPDSVYGTKLRIPWSIDQFGAYDVSRGVFTDYHTSASFGNHPVTVDLINTFTFTQNERALTPSLSARPVHYVLNGNERQIVEMSNSDIYDYLLRYRDWETDRKSTRLNSSHRL